MTTALILSEATSIIADPRNWTSGAAMLLEFVHGCKRGFDVAPMISQRSPQSQRLQFMALARLIEKLAKAGIR